MNTRLRKYAIILIICASSLIAILLKTYSPAVENFEEIPSDVIHCMESYLSAYSKEGPAVSVDYLHFEIERDERAYVDSGLTAPPLEKYEIIDIAEINNNLYAFTLNMWRSGNKKVVYNFVGNIDGKWYVMNNEIHIPENLRDNLNADDYTYDEEGYHVLDRENTIIVG